MHDSKRGIGGGFVDDLRVAVERAGAAAECVAVIVVVMVWLPAVSMEVAKVAMPFMSVPVPTSPPSPRQPRRCRGRHYRPSIMAAIRPQIVITNSF